MRLWKKIRKSLQRRSLQFMLSLTFTAVSVVVLLVVAMGYSGRFINSAEKMAINNNKNVLNQMNQNLDNYLHNMMNISNAMYYSIIKNTDFEKDGVSKVTEQMKLLYDANASSLVSISIFSDDGEIIAAQPLSRLKPSVETTEEEWFIRANEKIENLHFSTPHVENLFVNSDSIYHWVVSLSRSVEMTRDGTIVHGVVLVDMNFTGIEQICKNVDLGESGYVYIVDPSGELIYHPNQQLIYAGVFHENHKKAAAYSEGSHMEIFEGQELQITVKTVGYTGWKLIGVSPTSDITSAYTQNSQFMWLVAIFAILTLITVNMFVSARVANPIKQLEKSVRELERNNLDARIPQSGTYEIRHLAKTLQSMADNMRRLMDDIVVEQESKRKSEMDALQSQINPHFLYNTLDSIVWMIENERYDGAIKMVTALARLFRISLSKGKNIITVEQELQHVENYLIIQKVRYKNKFIYNIETEKSVLQCGVIKLSVQPLVENSIYHGMDFMDGDGEISIRAYQRDDDLVIEVEDNGPGMTEDQIEVLVNGSQKQSRTRGSGIGFHNVEERIQLYFGKAYGLEVESEPDEGTLVRARLPLISVEEAEKKGEGRL
ncbi:sensor histidine kinase [Clostridium sp. C105KSO13]|uniref:sensor histidine kinase n=1 Tax=Clostridium sp. C105KSO13 TaxID=1776045 RepID=UPI0007408083|nr:sensor histidine kinase [Clostridium sp. C105KSO13]CUX36415.1 Sensor histidine kinase YehU [Clostridium sp. C105KSO13]